MLCSALLGKPPLLSPLFATLVIDESFETVLNPTAERMRLLPNHCFYSAMKVIPFWGGLSNLQAQNTSYCNRRLDVLPATAELVRHRPWKWGGVVTSFADCSILRDDA
jgi:hypothetical protein